MKSVLKGEYDRGRLTAAPNRTLPSVLSPSPLSTWQTSSSPLSVLLSSSVPSTLLLALSLLITQFPYLSRSPAYDPGLPCPPLWPNLALSGSLPLCLMEIAKHATHPLLSFVNSLLSSSPLDILCPFTFHILYFGHFVMCCYFPRLFLICSCCCPRACGVRGPLADLSMMPAAAADATAPLPLKYDFTEAHFVR